MHAGTACFLICRLVKILAFLNGKCQVRNGSSDAERAESYLGRARSHGAAARGALPAPAREETGVEPRRSPRSGLGPRTALPEQGGVAAPPRMQVMSTCSFRKGAG